MGIRWVPGEPVPAGVPVRQVSGILYDRLGRVLLQDDGGRYNLPGGTPEPADADLLGTLARQCMEESQVRVSDAVPAGYQLVEEDGEVYAQVRMAGLIKELCPLAADPCTGRAYRRLMIAPLQAPGLLGWGPRGEPQLTAATALACGRWGLVLALGAPQEYVD
jgi:8-oxo-dGTP pyrophosphatase MutT (NUDIX family)